MTEYEKVYMVSGAVAARVCLALNAARRVLHVAAAANATESQARAAIRSLTHDLGELHNVAGCDNYFCTFGLGKCPEHGGDEMPL